MSGLQLNTAVPIRSPSTIKTTLPSFDDLLKSLEEPSTVTSHHIRNPHHVHPHHVHHQHVVHPPYPHHHQHHHHYRPPSTPPTPRLSLSGSSSSEEDQINSATSSRSSSRLGGRKRRSNSLPSISRTHMNSPFRELSVLPHSIEHHTNRIQRLKEGDGEWMPYSLNAVAPSSLPYHARPHYLPRFSTGSIPHAPVPALAPALAPTLGHLHKGEEEIQRKKSCSPLHHPHHSCLSHSQTPTRTLPRTIAIPSVPPMGIHRRSMSGSMNISHSPLSTSEPMTPSSISSLYMNNHSNQSPNDSATQCQTPTKGYGISSAKKDVIYTIPTNMDIDLEMDMDM